MDKLSHRFLGDTGLRVSALCLGTMTFGREASEEDSRAILDHYVNAGGNFIDTADVYAGSESESIIGRWLQSKNREDLVIATKVRFPSGEGPNAVGASRKHILSSIDASLKRLQTDYVDLYQVHAWDPVTPLEETLSTLDGLVNAGKVRYIGVSNFTGWQLQKALDMSRAHGWEPFVSLQPLYNLLDRYTEWELVPVCQNEGLGIIPWSPLRGGWLTGKYRRNMEHAPEGTRLGREDGSQWQQYNVERTWAIIDELLAVADEVGKTPPQTALNWLLQRPGVTAPIIGARTLEQLEDNLGAEGWMLDEDQIRRLNDVSELDLPYPYEFVERAKQRR